MDTAGSLLVSVAGTPRLAICGRWLYPLFCLRQILENRRDETSRLPLSLKDPVAGRAAAFLYAEIRPDTVHAGVASRGAIDVARRAGIPLRADSYVPAITCATERSLADVTNRSAAIAELEERIKDRDWMSELTIFVLSETQSDSGTVEPSPEGRIDLSDLESRKDVVLRAMRSVLS